MSDEDYKKVKIFAAGFADVLSDINKKMVEVEMLEDMVIYNTGKTKWEIRIIYRTYIGEGRSYIPLSDDKYMMNDDKYMKFLSDYIDCNFDIDILMAINEL